VNFPQRYRAAAGACGDCARLRLRIGRAREVGRRPIAVAAGALLLALAAVAHPPTAIASIDNGSIRDLIRRRLEAAGQPAAIEVHKELIHAIDALPRFYEARLYEPAWVDAKGPTSALVELAGVLRGAEREGFRPNDYHLSVLEQAAVSSLASVRRKVGLDTDPSRLADLDLVATDAYLMFASHALLGRINPETIDPEWNANRRGVDLAAHLQEALDGGGVAASLLSLLPSRAAYVRLREAYASYRTIDGAGGFPRVRGGPVLHPGDRSKRVGGLRARLAAEPGASVPVVKASDDPDFFDSDLARAVRDFQARHGLEVDGVVGPRTVEELNVDAGERAEEIALNLERWRWLPRDLGDRFVLVNIASAELDVVVRDVSVLNMKVAVGQTYRRTPVFSAKITYLVLNPYWQVPNTLAVEDILPQVKKKRGYLAAQGIRVLSGWGEDTVEVDPATIAWSKLGEKRFPYRFRQDPGPHNALGVVKFMFPNRFDVYLHDTPHKEIFDHSVRTVSSGCIRVQRPLDLAELLLSDDPTWTRERLMKAIASGRDTTVGLAQPWAIHLVYWTAWVNPEGTVEFRPDVYRRDRILQAAMAE
jgi:murein L,D-transpeptidase YcbB/YkuD